MQESSELYLRAFDGYKRTIGLSDSCTMMCVDMLARLLKQQGKFAEALPYYEMAFNHYTATLGPEHPDSWNAMGCRGVCERANGREVEGNALLRRAVTGLKKNLNSLPPGSPLLKSVRNRVSRFQKSLEFCIDFSVIFR